MSSPYFSLRQLLESGVHFGHRSRRWNPKMAPFIFGVRNKVHIINLQKTVPLLQEALEAIEGTLSSGGRLLFVGTKRQASQAVRAAAEKSGQYFVNHRWLGGMLTNWKTISHSINRLRKLRDFFETDSSDGGLTKKEILKLSREREKLEDVLGGIAEMGGRPDMVIVLDTNKDDLAIKEAQKLGVPVIGILDTNSDPDGITYPIPGNDDAMKAIDLYCDLFSAAALRGLKQGLENAGVDLGNAEILTEEVRTASSASEISCNISGKTEELKEVEEVVLATHEAKADSSAAK